MANTAYKMSPADRRKFPDPSIEDTFLFYSNSDKPKDFLRYEKIGDLRRRDGKPIFFSPASCRI